MIQTKTIEEFANELMQSSKPGQGIIPEYGTVYEQRVINFETKSNILFEYGNGQITNKRNDFDAVKHKHCMILHKVQTWNWTEYIIQLW